MTEQNQVNEIVEVQNQVADVVVKENNDYVVTKTADGKFIRKAKFADFSSIHPKDKAEKIWLLNLMEGSEETGNVLKDHVGKQIEVANIITRRYDKINEETGQTEYGVLTYLITPDKIAYVTSSKTVYFSIVRIMDTFGTPDSPEWENILLKVGKQKGQNGDIITVKMIG
jgi:hypothetical protein